jgi:hypothetical protein
MLVPGLVLEADAALEVTMCPMLHSFRTSGGVAATGDE